MLFVSLIQNLFTKFYIWLTKNVGLMPNKCNLFDIYKIKKYIIMQLYFENQCDCYCFYLVKIELYVYSIAYFMMWTI